MKKINWGKLYDRHAACLHCNPTSFCGCRWDNVEWCYDCLNEAVEYKTIIQKIFILIQLNFITLKNHIKYKTRCIIYKNNVPF